MNNKFKKTLWEWVPLHSVGSFLLGDNINNYLDKFNLQLVDIEDDVVDWVSYELLESDVVVHTEQSKIISIACYKHFFYKRINLIGLTLGEITKIIKKHPDKVDKITVCNDEPPQLVYEFNSLELQLWFKDGLLVTAFCFPPYN